MQRLRWVSAVVALAVSLAVTVAGCGGDDSASGKALSKAEFKKQSDAVCATFSQRMRDAVAQVPAQANPSDEQIEDLAHNAADALHRAADELHRAADDLRAVGYPEGLHDEADDFYDALDKAGDALAKDPSVLRSGNTPQEFRDIEALAKKIDITTCAQG